MTEHQAHELAAACEAVLLAALAGALGGCSGADKPPLPVHVTTISKLAAVFDQNQLAAEQLLKGHIAEVSGTVKNIDRALNGAPLVVLVVENALVGAGMELSKKDEVRAAALRPGDQVVLLCKSVETVLSVPVGNDCSIKQ